MRLFMLGLLLGMGACSSTDHSLKRIGPGMMEDSQDLRAGGYVN